MRLSEERSRIARQTKKAPKSTATKMFCFDACAKIRRYAGCRRCVSCACLSSGDGRGSFPVLSGRRRNRPFSAASESDNVMGDTAADDCEEMEMERLVFLRSLMMAVVTSRH